MPEQMKHWNVLSTEGQNEDEIRNLALQTGLHEITARLLYQRGYKTKEAVLSFFHLEDATPNDPFLLKDMDKAVLRVRQALKNHEKIAIYGDYDVDGVTSVSLLYLYLSEHHADVRYYIPSRDKEDYGLSNAAIDKLIDGGVSLIVTVDNGITANKEADYAVSRGIDMVITDHHECRNALPNAVAVVNPHRPDDSYPFCELAGVGVAFKLVCAMEADKCREEGSDPYLGVLRVCRTYSDLVAIGTIADVMPLVNENRLFVTWGLSLMNRNCRLGLRALVDAANAGKTKQRKIDASYIGFGVAPRMNAAGRVRSASIAVDLLLADTEEKAAELANVLCELNAERQEKESRIAEEAYAMIEAMPKEERKRVLVLDSDHWHQGIIGIVSSRITDRYGLPSILITYDASVREAPLGTDVGKGSGRSVKGLNLVNALADSEDLLLRFGGHELAAGLSVRRCDVPELRRRLNAYAENHLDESALGVCLDVDCEVEMRDLSISLADEINQLEPFGVSNPPPNFVLRDVNVKKITPMGGGKHIRMTIEKNGCFLTAVWFNHAASELPFEQTDRVDLLFQLNVNEFNGERTLQLFLQDARVSETDTSALNLAKERYEEIKNGAEFDADENILPNREDLASVYQFLRRESYVGKTSFPMRRLLASNPSFTYGKMKLCLRILQELQLCNLEEPTADHFFIEITRQPIKTNLEKSTILHKMRSLQRK